MGIPRSHPALWPLVLACGLAVCGIVLWIAQPPMPGSPASPSPMVNLTGNAPRLVVRVDDADSKTLPSRGFIERVTGAGAMWEAGGHKAQIILETKNTIAGAYAKILLHSVGLNQADVVIVSEFTDAQRIALAQQGATVTDVSPQSLPWVEELSSGQKPIYALVVLGNEPLDETTPTVDTVKRVLKAVEYLKKNDGGVILLTGGPTRGKISEARMMALVAMSRGVPASRMLLEEESTSTGENATLSAKMLEPLGIPRIVVVSKESHLQWAMTTFRAQKIFEKAETLAAEVSDKESIVQMRDYLKNYPNRRVQQRADALSAGSRGVD